MTFRRLGRDENLSPFENLNRGDLSLKEPPSHANTETDETTAGAPLVSKELLPGSPVAESERAASAETNESENRDRPRESVPDSSRVARPTTSPRKLEANRRNGSKSRGPTTVRGKTVSSWNSLRHGLLSKRLMKLNDQKAEEFCHLLASLQQDFQPVGAPEEILVEKIAYEYFRFATAAQYEDAESNLGYLSGEVVGNLVRYQTMINRQLFQAMNQLERLQRLRLGEDVPAPFNLQISHEISDQER
jgi:hypothetical protein